MKQYSAGPPDAIDKSASFCHIWNVPESSIVVQLNLSFLNRLSAQADQCSGEGTPTAGLLLGRIVLQASQVIAIEEFKPCQLDDGSEGSPSAISESLQRAFHRWRALRGKHMYPVGCYLIEAGDSLFPSKKETAIVSRALDTSNQALLIVRPNLGEAALFVIMDGRLQDNAPYHRFRLNLSNARNMEGGLSKPLDSTRAVLDHRLIDSGAREKDGRGGSLSGPVSIAALAIACASVGIWWVQANGRVEPVSSHTAVNDLRLEASQNDRSLRISWNAQSAAVQKAQSGSLKIGDGPLTKDIALELSQLKSGRMVYVPRNDDVKIALEVSTTDNIAYRDSVRVVNGSSAPYIVSDLPETLFPALRHSTPAEIGRITRNEPKQAQTTNDHTPIRRTEFPEQRPPTESPASEASGLTHAEAQVGAAPGTKPRQPILTAVEAPTGSLLHPIPELRGPAVQVSLPPPAEEPPMRMAEVGSKSSRIEPAKLVQQTPVAVPEFMKRMMKGQVTISLRVLVSENGKVQDINSGPETNAAKANLTKIFSAAARTWRYEPARRDGKPIPGVIDLQLRFDPAADK